MSEKPHALSTDPYKGVRDFYPEDMYVLSYIIETMREATERFGYLEYGASLLEPAELYEAKTGDEIVNQEMYTLTDQGERRIALRPEMTPTLARLVAKRRLELGFPIRLFSIPNVFRYERPQRGRLREHWQLNADIFGVESIEAEYDVIALAAHIMHSFGASDADFRIHVSDRGVTQALYDHLNLSEETRIAVGRIIDRKAKIDAATFHSQLTEALSDEAAVETVCSVVEAEAVEALPQEIRDTDAAHRLDALLETLKRRGIANVVPDLSIVRGFDYYTGPVFEVFDTHPDNNRSLFGGGRYDNLLEIFDAEPVPAVGFGMGDVTIRDFLETHNLVPHYTATTDLFLCTIADGSREHAQQLADDLRAQGVNVEVNLADKKVGDQVKLADKHAIPFVICIGEREMETHEYTLKALASGSERVVTADAIADALYEMWQSDPLDYTP
jgi:histidyl-tRNA synthetase